MEEKLVSEIGGEPESKTGGKLRPILIPDLGGIKATARTVMSVTTNKEVIIRSCLDK